MIRREVDFLVIGSGPAGSVFAALAARDGSCVLLVERKGYSAGRTGEYLEAHVSTILEAVGVPFASMKKVMYPSPAIVSLWDSPVPLTQPFRERTAKPPVAVIRHLFDHVLLDTAAQLGAEVIRITGHLHVVEVGRDWRISMQCENDTLEVSARFVVDASGRAASFARQLGITRETKGDMFATVLWFNPVIRKGNAVGPLIIEAAGAGWWSLAETPDNAQVAVYYTHKGAIERPRQAPTENALNCLSAAPYINARLRRSEVQLKASKPFPASPSLLRKIAGKNWIAVGDAAVTYDPLCGKGTLFAIQSACRAYEACIQDFHKFSMRYQEAIHFRFHQHITARRSVYLEAGNRLSESFLAGVSYA